MQEKAGQTIYLPSCGRVSHHEADFFEINRVSKQRIKVASRQVRAIGFQRCDQRVSLPGIVERIF